MKRTRDNTDTPVACILTKKLKLQEITALNQTKSPLLKLPGELRNAIYSFLYRDSVFGPKYKPYSSASIQKTSLGLLYTCRQIHEEARLVALAVATFRFDDPRHLCQWLLKTTPEQRSVIANLEFETFEDWGIRPGSSSLWQLNTFYMPEWWTLPDMTFKTLLPTLKHIKFLVAFESWNSLLGAIRWGERYWRDSKFSATGQLFGEMKEFVERANPGVSATMELHMSNEDDTYGQGPRRTPQWDEGREQFRWQPGSRNALFPPI